MAFAFAADHLDGDQHDAEDLFVPHPSRSMLVEASQEWEWAGIRIGDILVVERGRRPRNGDLVLVSVECGYQLGEAAMMRGALALKRIRRPYAAADVSGVGVVTRSLRIYGAI
jgi:hypothetical protein